MLYLAWRNLVQSKTQFLLGVGGVTLALLLMLALDALLTGSEDDLTAYIIQSGADVLVAQDGVQNMHMAASAITWRDLRLASHARGVISASPILYTTTVVETGRGDVLSYIIGFDPTERLGGPRRLLTGTTELQEKEALIDVAVARSQDLGLGDTIELFGEEFVIVGLTQGLTNIINSVTFIRLEDFADLRGDNAVSYALLQVQSGVDPNEVATAISARNDDVTALSQADFAREERQIIKDMSVEVLNLMNTSGLLIGLAVTGLTLYTSVLSKRREYGVLKAIGAKNRHLYAVVVAQTILSMGLGLGFALTLIRGMGVALPWLVPGVNLALVWPSVLRVLLAMLLIGIISALVPAWQVARLDPAQVFKG
ncbi:MAG: FtsX-like permease family protein [Anaerolineae bacterium]|nr:FtsX-like permease family protein [Anaerolineae bacterium]